MLCTLKKSALGLCFLGLAGCDGGPGDGTKESAQAGDGAGAPVVHATWAGEAVPGLTVILAAEAEGAGDIADWRWRQSDGPDVALEDGDRAVARFRVPAFTEDTELGFTVSATDRAGRRGSREVRVWAEALRLGDLHVRERAVAGQLVAFTADKDVNDRTDLYRVNLDGSNLLRLNVPAVPGANVLTFSISPDRRYVAYRADQDVDGLSELYVAHSDGSGVVKVNAQPPATGVFEFVWSPDSHHLAYRADQDSADVFELYTARPDGQRNRRVSGDMVAEGDVVFSGIGWHPDGELIAYVADQFTDGVSELFVSAADGSDNRRVSGPLVAGGRVDSGNVVWAPDGRYLAYRAFQRSASLRELFTVAPDGQDNRRVSHDFAMGSVGEATWAPDGSRLAYVGPDASGTRQIYTALPDGSGVARLSSALSDSGLIRWSPDATQVAFLADQDTAGVFEVYAAGGDATANRRVSGPMAPAGRAFNPQWSPDSRLIAYRADQITDNQFEVFVSAADGSTNVRVSGPMVAGGIVVATPVWSPDGEWLAYLANQLDVTRQELFTSAPDGSLNVRVSGPLVAGGSVNRFEWSSDGARLVYLADQLENNRSELFVAAPDGGAINQVLSGTLTGGGEVRSFAVR